MYIPATMQSARIGEIYAQIQQDLYLDMIEALTKASAYELEQNPFMWQLEKYKEFEKLGSDRIKYIASQTGKAEDLLYKILVKDAQNLYDDTWKELAKATLMTPAYAPIKNMLDAYFNQTFREIDNFINQTLLTTHFGSNAAMKQYQSMLEQIVAEVTAGLKSKDKAIKDVVMEWLNKGIPSEFIDKGGNVWSIANYARTVTQSTVYRVYNEMRVMASEAFGVDTFYMSSHAAARPACAPIQGGVVTKQAQGFESGDPAIGYVPSLHDYGWGEPSGTFGINCSHTLTPFVIGINKLPDDPNRDITPEQAMGNAKEQVRQRTYEREIRLSKKNLEAAKKLQDQDSILKYQTRLNGLRSGLRDLIDEHDFLVRNYARERFFA
ncbi:MAG: phage minor capsid protein [Streptococcaceae bacterium]|nr:phage minor capsid protein [Streptococcaceae bacterium]MCL2680890.1 phage minor capsid protein [Streptococcaceae bacterium]MCL2858086.1 phage minor capsid protein [Streptococcaceae bacterium]